MAKLNKHVFFTSFNRAYAPQAVLLAESLRRHYGDTTQIYALIVDKLDPEDCGYLNIFDKLILVEELEIPFFKSWIFRLDIVEASTAVKPFALCKLLEEFSHVTYLDPDTVVYSKFDEISDESESWDVALTPHQTFHQDEKWLVESTELESMRWGIYNLGFLSVKATENGKKIAQWWRDRCYHYCLSEPQRGLFTDQKLFDAAPALFEGVKVLRHPGYNVATWNIRERHVLLNNEKLVVNGSPLRFCHFTKASHIGAHSLQRMIEPGNYFEELFYGYVAQLINRKKTLHKINKTWAFGIFDDLTPISLSNRIEYRKNQTFYQVKNPFQKIHV